MFILTYTIHFYIKVYKNIQFKVSVYNNKYNKANYINILKISKS